MNIIEQFKNLLDPGNALGAFIISFIAGIASSFIGGYKAGRYIRNNSIRADEVEGNVFQDEKKKDSNDINVPTKNNIVIKKIKGNIKQDC